MVKSINTSQPLLRIVFQCNKRKKFWNFNYKYKFNIKKKHLQMLLVVYFHFWRQLLDAEVYWLPWAEEAIATVPGWIICIRKSNKILIKIYVILYKTNTYIFALRKTTTTQLIVNNIFISILFDFRMLFVQPGTPRTSDIESRISYLESRITLLGFRKLQMTLLESSNLFDWDISTVTRNICFFHCIQNKTCTFEKKPGGLVHSTKQWREQK